MPMLSEFPSEKVIVSCEKCGMWKQYDRDAMVRAGGDRTLAHLLDDIVARIGCPKANSLSVYDRCGAKYEELARLLGGGNAYAKAKGG
ncbi:hypothetical protein [Aminobacter niigataensis]|uniref:hypothetical protein n=1 Tax=Aminobacter niigataensis TaxID=83265 RepID=UPI0024C7BE48|nr:hypothetical protein [Aminobacter niigataensis]CAI2934991.1 conserved protein of unknown function [Aminobacter niigataensis]